MCGILPDSSVKKLIDISLEAARELMVYFRKPLSYEHKSDGSPVCIADRSAEELIAKQIGAVIPGIPIIGEEAVSAGSAPRAQSQYFLVDALDGTKGFLSGSPEFTVNIALIAGDRPVFGLVCAPALGEIFYTKNKRAWRARFDAQGLEKAEPLEQATSGRGHKICLVSRYHHAPAPSDIEQLAPSAKIIAMGSSLKFCRLAEGAADIYLRTGPTGYWDVAAGEAVLNHAGGQVCQLYHDRPLIYRPHLRDGDGVADPSAYHNPPFVARRLASAPAAGFPDPEHA